MLKRISLIAVAASVAVLAIVATAVATPAKSSATAATAKVTCGKVRSIGVATPITGPAASLGAQQLAWAQFYVKPVEQAEGPQEHEDTRSSRATRSSANERLSRQGRADVRVELEGPRGRRPGRQPGGRRPRRRRYSGGGLAWISGSATRTRSRTATRTATAAGYFFRVVPNDGVQGPTVANYIRNKLKANDVYIIDDQETYSHGSRRRASANLLKARRRQGHA